MTRLIVVPVIRDEAGRVLLCKMPEDRGVFPGQWGLAGGGVEPGERIEEALAREISEELGVTLLESKPLFFKDGVHEKTFGDGGKRTYYMVFLLFDCRIAMDRPICLNPEFCEYVWAAPTELSSYDLNSETRATFSSLGLI
jgi:nucleoside triphosphatase